MMMFKKLARKKPFKTPSSTSANLTEPLLREKRPARRDLSRRLRRGRDREPRQEDSELKKRNARGSWRSSRNLRWKLKNRWLMLVRPKNK